MPTQLIIPNQTTGQLETLELSTAVTAGLAVAQVQETGASAPKSVPDALAAKLNKNGPMTSLAETDTPANLPVFAATPQADWKGREFSTRVAPAPRSNYRYAGRSVTLIDPGSGQNGPATAGYGLALTTYKQGYPSTSSGVGELDTIVIAGRQSGPTPTTDAGASDYDGIQANYQMSGDAGYMAGAEFFPSRIDPTNLSITHAFNVQIGIIDPFGKNGETGLGRYSAVNRLSFGVSAQATQGPADRAFYATNTSTGSWEDFLYVGVPGTPTLRIKGATGAIKFNTDSLALSLVPNTSTGQLDLTTSNGTVIASFFQDGSSLVKLINTSEVTVNGAKTLTSRGTVIFPPQSALPANGVEGETVYYNHKLYTWDGTTWQPHW